MRGRTCYSVAVHSQPTKLPVHWAERLQPVELAGAAVQVAALVRSARIRGWYTLAPLASPGFAHRKLGETIKGPLAAIRHRSSGGGAADRAGGATRHGGKGNGRVKDGEDVNRPDAGLRDSGGGRR